MFASFWKGDGEERYEWGAEEWQVRDGIASEVFGLARWGQSTLKKTEECGMYIYIQTESSQFVTKKLLKHCSLSSH